jgi:FixJ family two-component response regulator
MPERIGLHLCDDLLFISRVNGVAQALGLHILSVRNAEQLLNKAQKELPVCVLLDLANPGLVLATLLDQLKVVCQPLPRLVAYGSHVDVPTLRAARELDCDPVWPRSKFVTDLATALPEWFATTPE